MENNGSMQNKKHYHHVHLLFTKSASLNYRFTPGHSRKLFSFKFNQRVGLCGFCFFFFPFREKHQRSDLCFPSTPQHSAWR